MPAALKSLALLAAVSLAACGSASASRSATTGATTGTTTGTTATAAGISGRVVVGPTCPVERNPPDPRCAPRPLQATLRIRRADGKGHTLTVHSGSNGRFRIALAPATYVLSPQPRAGSALPRPPQPTRVTVHRGRFAALTLTYDSGIR